MKIDFKVRKRYDGDIETSRITVYNPKHYQCYLEKYIEYHPKFDLFWIFNYNTEKMIKTKVYDFGFHDELYEIFNSKMHNYVE